MLRRLHFLGWTRGHLTMPWVVCFSSSRPFGPRRLRLRAGKSRGSVRDGTGVSDSIVNQLLSKIDGVDSLNNILVIGMTNRKDMIDEAILRAISASRGAAGPSLHSNDSWPSHDDVGGFFFDFEAVRTASSDRAGTCTTSRRDPGLEDFWISCRRPPRRRRPGHFVEN